MLILSSGKLLLQWSDFMIDMSNSYCFNCDIFDDMTTTLWRYVFIVDLL